MARETRIPHNRYLSHYLQTAGDLVEAISFSYCINEWIKYKIYPERLPFTIYRLIRGIDDNVKGFSTKARQVQDIKSLISVLDKYKDLIKRPFEDYFIPALTLSCMLNLLSQKFGILITLVSGDAALNYCLSPDYEFIIILYETDSKYYPGFSKNFVYEDSRLFPNYESGLKILNNDDDLAFNVLVSAISNVPKFLEDLGEEQIENILYFLDMKCGHNEKIRKNVERLKKILSDMSDPCFGHDRYSDRVFRCGRKHCVDCVQSKNKGNSYIDRCLCGKYIPKSYGLESCLVCEKKIQPQSVTRCGSNHVYCIGCFSNNSNACFVCHDLRCAHGNFIKKGYRIDMPNFSFECRSCNQTIRVI